MVLLLDDFAFSVGIFGDLGPIVPFVANEDFSLLSNRTLNLFFIWCDGK